MADPHSVAARRPTLKISVPRLSFGPYLMVEAMPWLLLSTVTRASGREMANGVSLLLLLFSEFALFLAFLIATQKMVEAAGGITTLGRLPMVEQLRLAWSAIWRLLLLFACVNLAAVRLGMHKLYAAGAWFGFDGIAFYMLLGWYPVWPAFIATLVFLFVIERGMEREPSAVAVGRQMLKRWRYLIPAVIFVSLFLGLMNVIQPAVGTLLQSFYAEMANGPVRNLLYIGFLFTFNYIRILVTLGLLTLFARAAWRADPGTSGQAS